MVALSPLGEALISQGKVAALLLAAGMGSRLSNGRGGSKGMLELTQGRSLFELFAEKVLKASRRYGRDLLLAIMTSPLNHNSTVDFFKSRQFFGLKPSQVSFFAQEMLPLFDEAGKLVFSERGRLAVGPAGNGAFYRAFLAEIASLRSRGVEILEVFPIDNPLASPFDPEFIGLHRSGQNEVTFKSVRGKEAHEKVGVIVERDGQLAVVEYSDRGASTAASKTAINLGLYALELDFIERAADYKLPLHAVQKACQIYNGSGFETRKLFKCEHYLFDAFSWALCSDLLLYPRDQIFAPLKTLEDIEHVKRVLAKAEIFC